MTTKKQKRIIGEAKAEAQRRESIASGLRAQANDRRIRRIRQQKIDQAKANAAADTFRRNNALKLSGMLLTEEDDQVPSEDPS